jgi:hypothetical protein
MWMMGLKVGVGARSPSGPSTGHGAAGVGPLAAGQRWSVALGVRWCFGRWRVRPWSASRGRSGSRSASARGRARAGAALEGALRARDPGAEGPELAAALRRIGAPSMENALLRATMGQTGPLARKRWR